MAVMSLGRIFGLLLATNYLSSAAAGCGGNFTDLSGIITSPNFPSNYSNGLYCTYVIRVPDHYRITVTVTFFDLEPANYCNKDYLIFHDGDSQTAPIMLRMCTDGETLPVMRRSFGNKMLISFVSDGQRTAQGFLIKYTAANQGDSFFLIAASGTRNILRMDTESRTIYPIPMERRLYNPMAVTYDPLHSRVYWTEVSSYLNAIRSAFLNGSDVRTLKAFGRESILEGIALDFHSRQLFYTDAGTQAIGMVSLSTLEHVIIVNSSLDHPRPIILDHRNRMMFWADVGGTARIEKAGYDGKDRRHIVNTRIAMVNGLAIDLENSRLYWADAITDDIEGSDLEGNNRFKVGRFTTSTSYVYGLVFFQGHLYMTNWGKMGPETNRSQMFRLTVDNRRGSFIGSIAQKVNDIHAFHELMPSADCSRIGEADCQLKTPTPEKLACCRSWLHCRRTEETCANWSYKGSVNNQVRCCPGLAGQGFIMSPTFCICKKGSAEQYPAPAGSPNHRVTSPTTTAPSAVDGGWSAWGSWAQCSASCDRGSRQRVRTCTNPSPARGGAACPGSNSQTGSCNLQSCPVNGGWSAWGSWAQCSASCDGGSRQRVRTCTNPSPARGGAACPGPNSQTGSCNLQSCPADCSLIGEADCQLKTPTPEKLACCRSWLHCRRTEETCANWSYKGSVNNQVRCCPGLTGQGFIMSPTFCICKKGSAEQYPAPAGSPNHRVPSPTTTALSGACAPGQYATLDESWRSVNNTVQRNRQCDSRLSPGWKRFLLDGKNAVMPTTCVPTNRCLTHAPIWLDLQGLDLPGIGSEREGRACAHWSSNCCKWESPITVKNCGDFLIYHVQPRSTCKLAYCVQYPTP